MCGRVGKKLPMHGDSRLMSAVKAAWAATLLAVVPMVTGLVRPVVTPVPVEDWAASFPPKRREDLLRIWKEGIEMPSQIRASSFIKRELTVKDALDLSFKDPRFIQGCPLEMSVRCGPYLRKLAKHVRKGLRPKAWLPSDIRSGRQYVYTCGMSAQQVGEAFARGISLIGGMCEPGEQVVFVEDDESRFDLHLTEGPFSFLDAVYARLLPRKLGRWLRRGVSRGRSNLGTRYSIPFTMQSGWPDTSVGDTLVNVALKFAAHGRGGKWLTIICGDDSVTITTDKELASRGGLRGLKAVYEQHGMEVKMELRQNALDVEFCSGRFWPTREGFVLMPKTGKLLAKLGWDQLQRCERDQEAWVRGIAATLASYGALDPILASMSKSVYRWVGRDGNTIIERNEYKHTLRGGVLADTTCTRDYMAHHYGLGERDIAELSTMLSSLPRGAEIDDPRIAAMVRHDISPGGA